MANFHSNQLVVVANERDMGKVLGRLAANLAAHKEEIADFNSDAASDLDELARLDTVEELAYEVCSWADPYYNFVFVGAPVPGDVLAGMEPGWESSTSSADGLMEALGELSRALGVFADEAGDAVTGVELKVNTPTGSYLSETANVGYAQYGANWVFSIAYSTAWCPNSADLDAFFAGLPAGDYGVAFCDADEGDWYESIEVFSGLHHGRAAMHDVEDEGCERGTMSADELRERARGYRDAALEDVADLAELAKMVAALDWSFEDDDDYDDEEDEEEDEERAISWVKPEDGDLEKIDNLMLKAIGSFPWCHRPDNGFSAQGNEAAEHLFPGDAVTVTSDWGSADVPGEVVFNVYDAGGTRLGVMDNWMDLCGGYWDSAVLACLLPHLSAVISELTPVSLRNKGVDGPKLSIRFDIESIDFDKLLAETHALLKKDCNDRTLSSKGAE